MSNMNKITWIAAVGDQTVRYEAEVVHERTVSVHAYGYEANRRHWFLMRKSPDEPWYILADGAHPAAAGIIEKITENSDEVIRLAAAVIRQDAKEAFTRRNELGHTSLTKAIEKTSNDRDALRKKWGITGAPSEYTPFSLPAEVVGTPVGPIYVRIDDHCIIEMTTTAGLPLPPSGLVRDPISNAWDGEWSCDPGTLPLPIAQAFEEIVNNLRLSRQDTINTAVAACDARLAHTIENLKRALTLWEGTVSTDLATAERAAEALLATLEANGPAPAP